MPADIDSFLGLNFATHCGGRGSTRWFSTGENGFLRQLKTRILATYPRGEDQMSLEHVQAAQMHRVRRDIVKRHPKLEVQLLLIGLDGKADAVA